MFMAMYYAYALQTWHIAVALYAILLYNKGEQYEARQKIS